MLPAPRSHPTAQQERSEFGGGQHGEARHMGSGHKAATKPQARLGCGDLHNQP